MKARTFLGIVALLAFLVGGVVAGNLWLKEKPVDPERPARFKIYTKVDASKECKEVIVAFRKSPSAASFPEEVSVVGRGPRRFEVSGYVDSQNSFGAMLRGTFTCEITFPWEADGRPWFDKILINGKRIH